MSARALVRGLIFIGSLVLIGFAIRAMHLDAVFDKAWIDADIRGQGLAGEALFIALGGLFTAIGLPRQVISFLAGYAFGFVTGSVIGVVTTVIGCVITFSYARFLGREFIARRFPGKVRRIDAFLSDNPFTMTLLIRFLPAGSNLLTNMAAGVSGVPAWAFILGSAIGYIPQTAIFALVGSGITVDTEWRIALSVVLFVISGLLGAYLYRHYRHGKYLDDDTERELDGDD